MTFGAHIKTYTGMGTVIGLAGAAYFHGESNKNYRIADRLERYGSFDCFIFFGFGIGSDLLSIGSAVSGPFVGAATGAGIYGAKKALPYLHALPKQVKIGAVAIPTLLAAAYSLGNSE